MSTMQRIIRSQQLSGSDATDADAKSWLYDSPGRLVGAYIDNVTAVTGNDTNNITVSATMNGETVFSRQTNVAGGSLAVNADEEQTLGATMIGDKLEVSKGDTITFAVAKAGTGPAYDLNVALVFEFARL